MHKIQAINKDIKKLLVIDCRFHLFGNPMNSLFQSTIYTPPENKFCAITLQR
jgi:hypothetical protein